MISPEKERIPFLKSLDPVDKNIEDWMIELEDMMKSSVRNELL